jgi:hypothetical protein
MSGVSGIQSTPYDEHFKRLDAAIEAVNGLGRILIRGVPDKLDEESNEIEVINSKLTEKDMDHMRWIIITQRRSNQLESMAKLVLGDQASESILTFNTTFSYEVLDAFSEVKATVRKTSSWGVKFDMLFAFTYTINEYDTWVNDHECGWGGNRFIRSLAKLWYGVLQEDNDILGIDSEFTRPGIIEMLQSFKTKVEDFCDGDDDSPEIKFAFEGADGNTLAFIISHTYTLAEDLDSSSDTEGFEEEFEDEEEEEEEDTTAALVSILQAMGINDFSDMEAVRSALGEYATLTGQGEDWPRSEAKAEPDEDAVSEVVSDATTGRSRVRQHGSRGAPASRHLTPAGEAAARLLRGGAPSTTAPLGSLMAFYAGASNGAFNVGGGVTKKGSPTPPPPPPPGG